MHACDIDAISGVSREATIKAVWENRYETKAFPPGNNQKHFSCPYPAIHISLILINRIKLNNLEQIKWYNACE